MQAHISDTIERNYIMCDSFHSKLNSSFNCIHRDILIFIEMLKNTQNENYIKLRNKNYDAKSESVAKIYFRLM